MSKVVGSYRLKYYIHASHAIRWEDGIGKPHSHSWEIICEFRSSNEKMIIFDKIEKMLQEVFSQYSNKLLNEVPPFDTINPTLENLTHHFFEIVSSHLVPFEAILVRLELGESPARYYCVTREDSNE